MGRGDDRCGHALPAAEIAPPKSPVAPRRLPAAHQGREIEPFGDDFAGERGRVWDVDGVPALVSQCGVDRARRLYSL
jgi:hypothetical protein